MTILKIKATVVTQPEPVRQRLELPVIDPTRLREDHEYTHALIDALAGIGAHEDTEVAVQARHLSPGKNARKPSGEQRYLVVDTRWLFRTLDVQHDGVLGVADNGNTQLWKPDDIVIAVLGDIVHDREFLHTLDDMVCPQ